MDVWLSISQSLMISLNHCFCAIFSILLNIFCPIQALRKSSFTKISWRCILFRTCPRMANPIIFLSCVAIIPLLFFMHSWMCFDHRSSLSIRRVGRDSLLKLIHISSSFFFAVFIFTFAMIMIAVL